ncbi:MULTISPECIES: VanZ family protein [unclassified Bradyrhizobium]
MNRPIVTAMLAVAAWITVSVIGYATLTKVQFIYQVYGKISPFLFGVNMATWAHLEHAIAFLTLGSLFARAYPRRTGMVCMIVIGSAIIFELLQTLTPDRHGTVFDASENIVAACAGIAAVRLVQLVRSAGKEA